ncbi:fukutin-related protein-like [Actinia tenebrosa]|uniref:Fukutin-related protein-like n=1 Tax=Actinia tenebrosa TaxID=6105 RepID=A0A6P8J3H6_ACTTE|nr:fukutin-related protein-like [Actinia tenebrosa]
MRRSWNRKRKIIYTVLLAGFCYYMYRNLQLSSLVGSPGKTPVRCHKTKEEIAQLVNISHAVHDILEELGIKHWLMFGSLWGIVRKIHNPLPWDKDVDIGLSGDDDNFSKLTREQFLSAFTSKGFILKERLDRNAIIGVFNSDLCPNGWVDLFVFYDYSGKMKRTGWETWLVPINYNLFSSFPSSAIQGSLPKARFGDFEIYVPRDIMLVLRNVYPYNWWKVDRPTNCIDD